MKRALEVGIIGLGKFGLQLGAMLATLGHTSVGLDSSPSRVQLARDVFTQVWEGDATDKATLTQLKFHNLDAVAVAVGSGLETSILVTLNLQELGVANIIVKASNPLHKKVLSRMGVERIIQPEIDVATQLAYTLDNPGMLDLLPIGKGVAVQEAIIEKWAGKTLRELNLRNASNVLVAAVREDGCGEYRFVPDPGRPLNARDRLLFIGYKEDVDRVLKKT